MPSGTGLPEEIVIRHYGFQYSRDEIFPKSATPADTTRQTPSPVPRYCYVDILKQCRACGRSFIFFAREQKYWYESLGFSIQADCVCCPECCRSDLQLRRRFKRYSEYVSLPKPGDDELKVLVSDAAVPLSGRRAA